MYRSFFASCSSASYISIFFRLDGEAIFHFIESFKDCLLNGLLRDTFEEVIYKL